MRLITPASKMLCRSVNRNNLLSSPPPIDVAADATVSGLNAGQ